MRSLSKTKELWDVRALADSAEDEIMLDVVGVEKAETEMGLVLFGDGSAEVCVFEIHLEAVVSDTRF